MLMFYTAMLSTPEEKRKFEQLYLQHRQSMYQAAYRILQNTHDAEDAVHQAFLQLVAHMEKINGQEPHKTKGFLMTITENAAIDIYRHRKRESSTPIEEVSAYMPLPDTLAEGTAFTRAYARLPVVYSTILQLKYSYGYENSEIAVLLNTTEENVRQRLLRSRKKLALLLQEEGIMI